MAKKVKKITESAFKNLIKEKVIQILEEEEVFPNTYDRRYQTRGERILEKVTLNEGLVRTYPFEWVEDYISKHVNSDFTKAEADDDTQHFRFIIKKDSNSIEPLKQKMEAFGYYCSAENPTRDKSGIYLQFEPKFDQYRKGSEFTSRNGNVTLYHVTPSYLKDKILANGLVPKSKNDFLKYPDRVYFTLAADGKDATYEMADMLYSHSNNKMNNGIYTLFGIKLDGLDDVKFYIDRNVTHVSAYFTYENIPPQNIVFIEDFGAFEIME